MKTKLLELYWWLVYRLVMFILGIRYYHCTRTAEGYAMPRWKQLRSDVWFLWSTRGDDVNEG